MFGVQTSGEAWESRVAILVNVFSPTRSAWLVFVLATTISSKEMNNVVCNDVTYIEAAFHYVRML